MSVYEGHGVTLHHGDCLDVLRSLPDCSVDSVVTDPPYNLTAGKKGGTGEASVNLESPYGRARIGTGNGSGGFMGKAWDDYDHFPGGFYGWCEAWATECLRVLKPGGHLLAFGGTRTWHRLACAVEDAGFEVRDSIARFHSIDMNNAAQLMKVWQEWTERVPSAGLRFRELGGSSAGDRVLLEPSHDESPARALIADLCSSGHPPTPAETWPSVASNVGAGSTASSALVTIAGASPESRGQQPGTTGSSAPSDAPEWLAASREATTRAAEALRIWLGAKPSSRPGATDALCAALSNALKHITCAHSETFRSYDTTWQTVCVSATTATTTASTAANLLAFTADTLAGLDPEEVMPLEADSGPLAWVYGSGFPRLKSLDVSKAIDKAAGAEREVVGPHPYQALASSSRGASQGATHGGESGGYNFSDVRNITAPATPDAERWQGWGTALKPAFEPVVVARKPLIGTVSANVLAHGTGALNIDACRIGDGGGTTKGNPPKGESNGIYGNGINGACDIVDLGKGRWPANVVLDESQAEALDEQSGTLTSGANPTRRGSDKFREAYGDFKGQAECDPARGADAGGASRFFFVASHDKGDTSALTGKGGRIESCETASTAAESSSPPRQFGDSALGGAVTSEHPDTASQTGSPSTSATPSGSRPSGRPATPTTQNIDAESSPEQQPGERTPTASPASSVGPSAPTVTTTTTTSPSTSAGSAAPATSDTTSQWKALGDTDSAPFKYVAKADATERPRVNGTAHPTVKPLSLMRWLVRLVTPPGGTILEPFAGSGTTVEACIVEGFQCIAIEREADYLPLIRQRIDRRRDPVEALRGQAADLGLFDLLGGEGA